MISPETPETDENPNPLPNSKEMQELPLRVTSMGQGILKKIRKEDGMHEIELLNWTLTNNAKVKIYTPVSTLPLPLRDTFMGPGTLKKVRTKDGMHEIELINWKGKMYTPASIPTKNARLPLPKSKWDVRIIHCSKDLLNISLVSKRGGGAMVRSAPSHKRMIRRGMTLISINFVNVETLSLNQIVAQLKLRPLDLLFRPPPRGTCIEGAPDPNAPPPRPTPKERREAAAYLHREKRKQALKQTHLKMIQRYRIGPPKETDSPKEIEMCHYRNTFHQHRNAKKEKLKAEFFREQWERRFAGYVRTLELVYDAMDVDHDGSLTRHEIFKSIITDQHVQSLLALSPNVERLLSPWQFHKSWGALDEDGGGEVDRAEFVKFAMNSESGTMTDQEVGIRAETPLDMVDIDIGLLKMYKDLKRFAGGVDPTRSQVAEWLSDSKTRRTTRRSHMRRHTVSFDRMTSNTFLQYVVGCLPIATTPTTPTTAEVDLNQDQEDLCPLRDWMTFGWDIAETGLNEMQEKLENRALRRVFA